MLNYGEVVEQEEVEVEHQMDMVGEELLYQLLLN
jgi:hypothetical protein